MEKKKIKEGWNLFWQWFFLMSIPSVGLILLIEFGKVIYEVAGFKYALLFYGVGGIAIIVDIVILIIKTWGYLKPMIEEVLEIIEGIISFFRK